MNTASQRSGHTMKNLFKHVAAKKSPEERLMRALIQLGIVCAGVDAGAQGVSSRRSNALFKQAVQESFGQFQAAPMRPHIDTAIQLNFFLGRHGALGGVDGAVNLIRELRGQGTADGKKPRHHGCARARLRRKSQRTETTKSAQPVFSRNVLRPPRH